MPEVGEDQAKELESLRAEAARAKELEKAHQAKEAELNQFKQQYQQDAQQVQAWARQVQAELEQAKRGAKPTPEEDPDEPITKGQIGKVIEAALAAGVNPTIYEYHVRQRATNKSLAKRDIPDFSKYEKEIDEMLNQQPPQVASSPGAYEAAYKAVLATRIDEVVEDRVKARLAPPPDEDEADFSDEGRHAPRRPEAPSPAISAVGGAGARPKKSKVEPLSSEEARYARMFNMEDEEYNQYFGTGAGKDGRYAHKDIFGFRDPKTGKIREKV